MRTPALFLSVLLVLVFLSTCTGGKTDTQADGDEPDLCASVECEECHFCDPATGSCVYEDVGESDFPCDEYEERLHCDRYFDWLQIGETITEPCVTGGWCRIHVVEYCSSQNKVCMETETGAECVEKSDAVPLTARGDHTCAVTDAGGVVCWGANLDGQLGNGRYGCLGMESRSLPTAVLGLSGRVVAVETAYRHTCALMEDGEVNCWGLANYPDSHPASCGGDIESWDTWPTEETALATDAVALAAASDRTCLLRENGHIRCRTERGPFVDVAGLTHRAVALAGGGSRICAVLETGRAVCLGATSLAPEDLHGFEGGIKALAFSPYDEHGCALMDTGAVYCFGNNDYGQVGDATTVRRPDPVEVGGISGPAIAIVAGANHTCALLENGGVMCWGRNQFGQLGDGTTEDASAPRPVAGLSAKAVALVAGNNHTCAALEGGAIQCWGDNTWGQLGNGVKVDQTTPTAHPELSSGVKALALSKGYGYGHHCALMETGEVACWGANSHGQLGDGTSGETYRRTSGPVSGLPGSATALSVGLRHTCALLQSGAVMCWGRNTEGQLGEDSTTDRALPTAVSGLSEGVVAIEAGLWHTCALLDTGAVSCWGENASGQLGNDTLNAQPLPAPVAGLTASALSISAGDEHTCALLEGGAVFCWGKNGESSVPYGSQPVEISGLSSGVSLLASGSGHACALLDTGELHCWGRMTVFEGDEYSQTCVASPNPVERTGFSGAIAELALGQTNDCVRLATGGLMCWGANYYGQLGDGMIAGGASRYTCDPVEVPGLSSVTSVATGSEGACAILEGGAVSCWGSGEMIPARHSSTPVTVGL